MRVANIQEAERIKDRLRACRSQADLREVWGAEQVAIQAMREADATLHRHIVNLKDQKKKYLPEKDERGIVG